MAGKTSNVHTFADPYVFRCPHCDAEWEVSADSDDCYSNDVADKCCRACPECNALFQLAVSRVAVFFEVRAITGDYAADGLELLDWDE